MATSVYYLQYMADPFRWYRCRLWMGIAAAAAACADVDACAADICRAYMCLYDILLSYSIVTDYDR